MKKLYESAFARWSAFVLLCISGVICAVSVIGILAAHFGPYNTTASYFESDTGFNEAYAIAARAVSSKIGGYDYGGDVSYDNTGWLIREFDRESDSLQYTDRNNLAGYTTYFSFVWSCSDEGPIDLWRSDQLSTDVNEMRRLCAENPGLRCGRIEMYFTDPQDADDFGYKGWRDWTSITRLTGAFPWMALISGLFTVFLLIWCLCASGHEGKGEETRLYFIDRVPLEILAAVCLVSAGAAVGGGFVVPEFIYDGLTLAVIAGAVLCLGISLLVYLLVFSIARRVKKGTFVTSTLVYMLGRLVYLIVRKIPEAPFTAAFLSILWVANAYMMFDGHPGILMSIVAFVDLCAGVYAVHKTICSMEAAEASGMVVDGNLHYRMSDRHLRFMTPNEKTVITNLSSISDGMAKAVEEQMKSEHLKTELITNVSHDIKTPLTSIVSYTDLLQKETDEEKRQEYLEVLARNAARLKKLSEDLVEASKASTGNVHTEIVSTSVREMVEQALGEYEDKLKAAELQPVVTLAEEGLMVKADGRLLWRVLSNLLSNCVKYAQPGTRVYINAAKADSGHTVISVKNISRDILNISSDELMERFVRGDQARSSEGSGLGLSIARSLTEVMKGTFTIQIDGDLFRADIALPTAEAE